MFQFLIIFYGDCIVRAIKIFHIIYYGLFNCLKWIPDRFLEKINGYFYTLCQCVLMVVCPPSQTVPMPLYITHFKATQREIDRRNKTDHCQTCLSLSNLTFDVKQKLHPLIPNQTCENSPALQHSHMEICKWWIIVWSMYDLFIQTSQNLTSHNSINVEWSIMSY